MTLSLTVHQRQRIGTLIWANIDGVAKNVMPVIRALNNDASTGIRIVALDEWERCTHRLEALQQLVRDLEARTGDLSLDCIRHRLEASLADPQPAAERTEVTRAT